MSMTFNYRYIILPMILLPALLTPVHAASSGTVMMRAGTLSVKQMQPDGAVLATYPASPLSQVNLPAGALQTEMHYPAWNVNRGIYHTAVPGIGFSFCTQEGGHCLNSGNTYDGSMLNGEIKNFALRLYKIGEVKAGDYDLAALFTLSHAGIPVMTPGLSTLRLNVSQCSVTRDNLRVTFPNATLGSTAVLSSVGFHLPVKCQNASDYHNINIHFSFNGKKSDAQHITTSLPGISLGVKNGEGHYVDFSATPNDPRGVFHDTDYVAELTRTPGEQAQAGHFDVSITAEVEMR